MGGAGFVRAGMVGADAADAVVMGVRDVDIIDLPNGYYIKNSSIMQRDPEGDVGVAHFVRCQTSANRKMRREGFAAAMNATPQTSAGAVEAAERYIRLMEMPYYTDGQRLGLLVRELENYAASRLLDASKAPAPVRTSGLYEGVSGGSNGELMQEARSNLKAELEASQTPAAQPDALALLEKHFRKPNGHWTSAKAKACWDELKKMQES